jgi:hypothetical protein
MWQFIARTVSPLKTKTQIKDLINFLNKSKDGKGKNSQE